MTEKQFSADSVPELTPGFRLQWEQAQNCHVLLYPEGMVQLNGPAGEIMKRIDGELSSADLITKLKEAFPGAEIDNDVYNFLEAAHDNGWIRAKA